MKHLKLVDEERPSCFGRLFDKAVPECVGGGISGRYPCDFQESCSYETAKRKSPLRMDFNFEGKELVMRFGFDSLRRMAKKPELLTEFVRGAVALVDSQVTDEQTIEGMLDKIKFEATGQKED